MSLPPLSAPARLAAGFALLLAGGWISDSVGAAESERESPSYYRQIAPLFGKLGCNGGTCHGAVQGRNGFRLSMFAADPAGDHVRLVREAGGRRIDFFQPSASLLLLKATGRLAHGGGVRIAPDSREYAVLRAWIAAGAPRDDESAGKVRALRLVPAKEQLAIGESSPLVVEAEFADGGREDVTAWCAFESLDRQVATVDRAGMVVATGVGDAGLVARYRDEVVAARVVVPRSGGESPAAGETTAVAPRNSLDVRVLEKLHLLRLPPAAECDDEVFLRRLSLDVTGQLPEPDEVRAFLAEESPDKRVRLIDRLLSHPGHADLWALRFGDILKAADFGVYADALSQEHDAPRMQAWLRARLRENIPYDELVARILLATSREGRTMDEYAAEVRALFEGYAPGRPDLERYARRQTLDLYWQRRGSDGVQGALQVAHAFLGLRLECAQCHRHPHDVWQQDDLLDFANLFMRVRTVGFQGENEKKFADAAEHFQRFNAEAKALEAEVKSRREGEGKQREEEGKAARQQVERLTGELARLEKAQAPAAEVQAVRESLEAARQTVARAEEYRQATAELERRAKLLPEVARRLLQAECRLLPTGSPAKVTSTLGTRESRTFRLLGESTPLEVSDDDDPRAKVMEWLRRPDQPYFSRALVNRVWAHYFGRGIIDPPDNLSAFNPATHPELLQELCDRFVAHGYDLRWLHRTIVTSRTYQQASQPAPEAAGDRAHYASFPLRRLMAEVLLDALNSATGTVEDMDMKYYHWPAAPRAVQLPFVPRNPFVAYVLETYGRPARKAAVQCDCERDGAGSIFQVLTLANHPRVWEKINHPTGRVARLVQREMSDAERLEELFLATLTRRPTDAERAACERFVSAANTPAEGWRDVLWSLLNTREFLLQH
ncbi:MAG: DUF1553 domain-containing protein [Pirellulales bacterium]